MVGLSTTSSAANVQSDDWGDPQPLPLPAHHYQFHLAPGRAGQSLGYHRSVIQFWFKQNIKPSR